MHGWMDYSWGSNVGRNQQMHWYQMKNRFHSHTHWSRYWKRYKTLGEFVREAKTVLSLRNVHRQNIEAQAALVCAAVHLRSQPRVILIAAQILVCKISTNRNRNRNAIVQLARNLSAGKKVLPAIHRVSLPAMIWNSALRGPVDVWAIIWDHHDAEECCAIFSPYNEPLFSVIMLRFLLCWIISCLCLAPLSASTDPANGETEQDGNTHRFKFVSIGSDDWGRWWCLCPPAHTYASHCQSIICKIVAKASLTTAMP